MPETPLISVVATINNSRETIDRAIRSLVGQTISNWELLAVDDFSNDGSHELLQNLATQDSRIRLFQAPLNSGTPACRNLALQNARGQYVCYLDCETEYYPDYLETVAKMGPKGDVLVFCYDVKDECWLEGDPIRTFDPEQLRLQLFLSSEEEARAFFVDLWDFNLFPLLFALPALLHGLLVKDKSAFKIVGEGNTT
jgi:glycosyltransferase involved in cell wall biosynthesis